MEGTSSKQFASDTENTTDEVKTTKLVDLNEDCLEKLFWYLNIDDLVNIVVYDSRFEAMAKRVFMQKFCQSDETIVVSNLHENSYNLDKLNHSIHLLNIFGNLITNICIKFKFENIDCLLDAIKRNCGQNIVKLEFDHERQVRMKIYMHEKSTQSMNQFLKKMNQQVPCLRELSLVYGSNVDDCPYWYDTNDIVIPSLTHFSINGRFSYEMLKRFVGANPQIEKLSLKCEQSHYKWYIEDDFIPLLDNALPQLKYLQMGIACHEPNSTHADHNRENTHPVYLQHLKKFTSTGHSISTWKPNFLQFAGGELEELELHHFICANESFLDSILHFKQLNFIEIEVDRFFDEEKRLQFEIDANAALMNDKPIKVTTRRESMRNSIVTGRANLQIFLDQLHELVNREIPF